MPRRLDNCFSKKGNGVLTKTIQDAIDGSNEILADYPTKNAKPNLNLLLQIEVAGSLY